MVSWLILAALAVLLVARVAYCAGETAGWVDCEDYYKPVLDRWREDVRTGRNPVRIEEQRRSLPLNSAFGWNAVDPYKVPTGKPGEIFIASSEPTAPVVKRGGGACA